MNEVRKARKLRRRARRLGRSVVRSMRRDAQIRALGVRFMRGNAELSVEYLKGVEVFWISPGGYIDASTLRTELVKAQRDSVGLHVAESEEHLNDRGRWAKLETIACEQMRAKLIDRIEKLAKAAYGEPDPAAVYDVTVYGRDPRPPGLTFGVWPKGLKTKAYIEQDNWYFHVLMKMPVGGFIMPVKPGQPLIEAHS